MRKIKHRTWIEISRSALEHNVRMLGRLCSNSQIGAVVKSNAYGHGLSAIVSLLEPIEEIVWLFTAGIEEALLIRTTGSRKNILALAYADDAYSEAILHDIDCAIYDITMLAELERNARIIGARARAHLKIDTGMTRLGLQPAEVVPFLHKAKNFYPHVDIVGIFTHLADTNNPDQHFSCEQLDLFNGIILAVRDAGYTIPYTHALSSGGLLLVHARPTVQEFYLEQPQSTLCHSQDAVPGRTACSYSQASDLAKASTDRSVDASDLGFQQKQDLCHSELGSGSHPTKLLDLSNASTRKQFARACERTDINPLDTYAHKYRPYEYNVVRVGTNLYGQWKSDVQRYNMTKFDPSFSLRPILTWKTSIIQIKEVPAYSSVGYNCSFTTSRASVIAILPVGYWDGYPRSLSHKTSVLIDGRYAPVIGLVSMNLIAVEVTDLPGVYVGQDVILLGGEDKVSATALARLAGTINNELLTRLNPDIERIIVD